MITTLDRQSDDLLIFLQGGGLCAASTPGACLRINIPFAPLGVLSGATEQPFAAFNVGYIPYCDGSLFLGDVTQTIDDEVFVQRGRQNITAAMDALSAQFPNPRRVVLLGISGGAFGTVFAGPMARVYFPNAEVLVVNDSGVGITRGEREPAFVDELLEALEADQLVPESCD
ncbi:MAG: hypothetical protein KC668_31840, partial [Myxococcales bacterium]|nr:hypothetical protein [Myxococcales bacterium]